DVSVKYKIGTMDPNYQLPAGENDLPDIPPPPPLTGNPLIDKNREPKVRGVKYTETTYDMDTHTELKEEVPLVPIPHVGLTTEQFKEYLKQNPHSLILFRGVSETNIDEYANKFRTYGLGVSSAGGANGERFYRSTTELGREAYLSSCPWYSFRYALVLKGAIWTKNVSPENHGMFLATFLPQAQKTCSGCVCTGHPSANGNFVLCRDYYKFDFTDLICEINADVVNKQLTNYAPLPQDADAMCKAIRGFQIWLLNAGVVIDKSERDTWNDTLVGRFDEADANRKLKLLGADAVKVPMPARSPLVA
ncbi:MAG: hypothetical protein IKE41_04475, partial [Clostridia bacterium]|nr:hypothetical protein [Clostridia bacterium]